MSNTLRIKYASPDSAPSLYGGHGTGIGVPMVQPGLADGSDYWLLRGPMDLLRGHVNSALAANDLNDYYFEGGAR